MICGGQNALSENLQASYKLCVGQNVLSKPLEASYTLCGGQNRLSQHLQTYTRFAVVKTHSASLQHDLW